MSTNGVSPILDVDYFKSLDLFSGISQLHRFDGGAGPCRVLAIEERRAREAQSVVSIDGTPVDVYALGLDSLGLGPHTKIGGVPYRRAHGRDEPSEHFDLPLLAQVCLADSRDFLHKVPGDVLSLFASDEYFGIVHEWQPLGIPADELQKDVPESARTAFEATGYRFRTKDFENVSGASNLFPEWAAGAIRVCNESSLPLEMRRPDCCVAILIYSIYAVPGIPYPWVDRPDPWTIEQTEDPGYQLDFRDRMDLLVHVRNDGEIEHQLIK